MLTPVRSNVTVINSLINLFFSLFRQFFIITSIFAQANTLPWERERENRHGIYQTHTCFLPLLHTPHTIHTTHTQHTHTPHTPHTHAHETEGERDECTNINWDTLSLMLAIPTKKVNEIPMQTACYCLHRKAEKQTIIVIILKQFSRLQCNMSFST